MPKRLEHNIEDDISRLKTAKKLSGTNRAQTKRAISVDSKRSACVQRLAFERKTRSNSFSSTSNCTSLQTSIFNKSGDRKQINAEAVRIVEILRQQSCFGNSYLPEGLRSMSTKLFKSVISFFMRSVVGNSYGCHLTTAKLTIEEMTKFLSDVAFPYRQSTSWMKTPNAPHALINLVELLKWLCMFIPTDNETQSFEQPVNLQDIDKCFPNTEFISLFIASTKNNFSLWNNKQYAEFGHSKGQLVDMYILMRTGIRGKAQIEFEIDRNKREFEGQLQMRFVVKEQKQLDEMLIKQEQLERESVRLLDACTLKTFERDQLHDKLHKQQIIENELSQKPAVLEDTIARQPVSVADRELKIVQLNEQRELLYLIKDSVTKLKDLGLDNQMHLARALKRQNDTTVRYNHIVHKEFLRMEVDDWYGISTFDLYIKLDNMDNLNAQVDRITGLIETIKHRNTKKISSIHEQNSSLRLRLQAANANHEALLHHCEDVTVKCSLLERQLVEVATEVLAASGRRQSAMDSLTEEIDGLLTKINLTQSKVNATVATVVQLSADNEKTFQEYERQAQQLLQAKRVRVQQRRAASDALNDALAALMVDLDARRS